MNPAEAKHGINLIQTFLRLAGLGAEWVMWLLLAMGFLCVVIVFERLVLFLGTRVDVTKTARQLVRLLAAGKVQEAQQLVKAGKALEERVVSDALSLYTEGADAVEEVMQASMIRERQRYERYLSYLGTVGSNGPFIGLLGTVIGVILAFAELGRNPKGGLEVVGPGISEALVATAVGLLVAIPALMSFNWLKAMLKKRVSNADFLCRMLIAQLRKKSTPELFDSAPDIEPRVITAGPEPAPAAE
jgi:biopolymer transport protein ExbB